MTRPWARYLFLAMAVAGCFGGCRCEPDGSVESGPQIGKPSLAQENPAAPRPKVVFPSEWHTSNTALNACVDELLEACRTGDYEGFRRMFGAAYTPPEEVNFEHVWRSARTISVAGLGKGPGDSSDYYIYVVVDYREPMKPEAPEEKLRDIVARVYQEEGQWRLGPAPSDISRAIVRASTQPAGVWTGTTEPGGEAGGAE